MTTELENQRKLFIETVHQYIKRDGIEDLLTWLDTTDFYTAPASTKYHGNYAGGLAKHCLAVYHELVFLMHGYSGFVDSEHSPKWLDKANARYTMENVAIAALFHDLCKVNTYKQEFKNVKKDGEWVSEPYYVYDEKYKFGGHGSKSVYLCMKFIQLSDAEASAINAHMGAFDMSTYSQPANVYNDNPLAWLLHVADESATYVLDK
jgi:hypothetical protein